MGLCVEYLQAAQQQQGQCRHIDPVGDTHHERVAINDLGVGEWNLNRYIAHVTSITLNRRPS